MQALRIETPKTGRRSSSAAAAVGLYSATAVLLTTCLGVLVAQIDTSVVNLAARRIGTDFGVGVSMLQWIVDAYNLTYAALLLTGGTLGDLYGRRRIFAIGLAVFTAGSLVCGLAPDAATLITGRAVTGLGAALELPVSLALLAVACPDPAARARAIGIWASCNGLAMALGPTLGGWLVDAFGWRSIFLLIVPVSAAAMLLAMRTVPESADPQGRRLDLPGQVFAAAALGLLALTVIEGPHWGWRSPPSLGCMAACLAAAALFFAAERRAGAGALVPLGFFRSAPF